MAEITLLRHGQASFGADNYDQLSALGHQQAYWLGEHFRALGESFDRIITGSMTRHTQTAEGFLKGLQQDIPLLRDHNLNEYDFAGLLTPLKNDYPELWVETDNARRDYYHNMKLALDYWMKGIIDSDGQDSWLSFCERTVAGFTKAYQQPAKKTLVVSSGGPIAAILSTLLQLDHRSCQDITLQIKNTSITKLLYRGHQADIQNTRFTLDSFNNISHLQSAEKIHSITFS